MPLPVKTKNANLISIYETILGETIEVPYALTDTMFASDEIMDVPVKFGNRLRPINTVMEELRHSLGQHALEKLLCASVEEAEDLTHAFQNTHQTDSQASAIPTQIIWGRSRVDENAIFAYWERAKDCLNPESNEPFDVYAHDEELQKQIDDFMLALKLRVDKKLADLNLFEQEDRPRRNASIQNLIQLSEQNRVASIHRCRFAQFTAPAVMATNPRVEPEQSATNTRSSLRFTSDNVD